MGFSAENFLCFPEVFPLAMVLYKIRYVWYNTLAYV